MGEAVFIGIIGDFDPSKRSHQPTMNALRHAADYLSAKIEVRWLPTKSLLEPGYAEVLGRFAGLWAAPGSPYQSQAGAHRGIRFAREQNRPFMGT